MGGMTQLVAKKLERQADMEVSCLDLEKPYDVIPREMGIATLKCMAVPQRT